MRASIASRFVHVLVLAAIVGGCDRRPPQDEPKAAGLTPDRFVTPDHDYFKDMDGTPTDQGGFGPLTFRDPSAIKGRNDWILWTGGNEAFWDWLARNGYGTIDLLRLLDSRERSDRFARAGLISEPGMRPPTDEETAESYGVYFDRPIEADPANKLDELAYGRSSGIVGLRLFNNPEFKGAAAARWDAERYYRDPDYASHPDTIRPFRVGMSCAFCHVAPHPLNPPADPERPEWANLSGNIGNQFMRVRAVFGNRLEEDNFLYHVLDSQLPGTIDTSLVASDNINNANTMNAVFGLRGRVARALRNPFEVLSADSAAYPGLWTDRGGEVWDVNPRPVPRVLLDGSDSVGAWLALARVYLNIGTYHQQWVRLHNPLLGFRPQQPFKIADCAANSIYWQATADRIDPLIAYFLECTEPMRLKDAPGGMTLGNLKGEGVPWDPAYASGRAVFAKGCIACHSSVQPGDRPEFDRQLAVSGVDGNLAGIRLTLDDLARLTRGDGELPPAYAAWAREAVQKKEFWVYEESGYKESGYKESGYKVVNYLSTDQRIPVSLTRTNSARAMATNALHGQMWEDFSSFTYKELPSVGVVRYHDPLAGTTKTYNAPGGGRGYYRVPTLISIWATAPFLHNNALGSFKNNPSVAGRLAAFEDAARKLLWPERRLQDEDPEKARQRQTDGGQVWRTSANSYFVLPGHHVPVLLAGLTGWSPFWVALAPWAPSLAFIILGVALLLSTPLIAARMRLEAKSILLRRTLAFARSTGALIALALAVVLAVVAYRNLTTLEVIDSMEDGPVLLRLQAFLPAFFMLMLLILLILSWWMTPQRRQPVAYAAGLSCFVAAIILAISFGRHLSGHGPHLKLGPIPQGVPVNLLASMDPQAPSADRKAALRALVDFVGQYRRADAGRKPGRLEFEQQVAPALMKVSKCPDFVMDAGHDYAFMRHLADSEKTDLIDLLKTF